MVQAQLQPTRFRWLDPRSIKPRGWLLRQLTIQAQGLAGNLDRFWPDVKESRWIGGTAEGWERFPYWLDGFIPLAWLLDDADMKARAARYVDYIITHQEPDGWLCPTAGQRREEYDLWAFFLMLKVLVLYHGFTGDVRVERCVRESFRAIDRHIDRRTLFNWGQTRWFEALIALYWLYERAPEPWLLDLATKLRAQGFDWIALYERWPYTAPHEPRRWSQMNHVVNQAMMLKSGPLLWRLTGDPEHLRAAERMMRLLDEYHGMVTGVFSGDECLAGKSPIRGTELCAVAELMYSLEHLTAITGAAHWGDRLEQVAFNALPATFSPDMWTHQYDQQVNQVQCTTQERPVFGTNGGQAHLFGLEPNFGCCTANLGQPWPKFALSTWMRSDDGFAVTAYAPVEVRTEHHGVPVVFRVETEYPFRDTVRIGVEVPQPVAFTLELRVPAWARGAQLVIGGEAHELAAGGYHPLRRMWSESVEMELRLPMEPQLVPRPNNLYALVRGPLVYALPVPERWERINVDVPGREYPHCDYEVHPAGPWNYGLCLKPDEAAKVRFEERPVGDMPFSPAGAPVVAHVVGRKVDWELVDGSAAPCPRLGWVAEEREALQLIPYGCTNLRLTEMPLVP